MSLTRLSVPLAAVACFLSAAPLPAQETAPTPAGAPARDSLAARIVPLTPDERAKFVGDYDVVLPNGWIMPVLVFVEQDRLMAQPEGEDKSPLDYLGGDTFGLAVDPTMRLAFEVKEGKVLGGRLSQRGTKMVVIRRP